MRYYLPWVFSLVCLFVCYINKLHQETPVCNYVILPSDCDLHPKGNHNLIIPNHWSDAQVDAIFNFLSDLATAIFGAYETEIVNKAQEELALFEKAEADFEHPEEIDEDDDLPW